MEKKPDVKQEVAELINTAISKINNLDSRIEKADIIGQALNNLVAGVELSKLEKKGMMTDLLFKRMGRGF
jgi:hypothetical protein